jgi:hypothetical protein
MESVDAKMARAHEHFADLGRATREFHDSTKRNFVLKYDHDREAHWIVYWVDDPFPPMRLSTLVGDCVFNMRSALDNLVCGLVRAQKPDAKCAGTRFPIQLERAGYENEVEQLEVLKGVPPDAIAIIRDLQPFNRPEDTRRLDPLFILNQLSNRDKHRAVMLSTGYQKNAQLVIHGHDGKQYLIRLTKPLYSHGPEIIPLDLPAAALRGDTTRVAAMGTAVLAFRDESGPWADRSIDEVLAACLNYIEEKVLAPLKPFFPDPPNP